MAPAPQPTRSDGIHIDEHVVLIALSFDETGANFVKNPIGTGPYMMEKFERTQENIAQTIGKSRSHVANTMRLLALPEEVQSYLVSGELTAGHARAIAAAADPVALAKQIIDGGLSVRETEALARKAPNQIGRAHV